MKEKKLRIKRLMLAMGVVMSGLFFPLSLWSQDDGDTDIQGIIEKGLSKFLEATDNFFVNNALEAIPLTTSMGSLFSVDYKILNVSIRLPFSMLLTKREEGAFTKLLSSEQSDSIFGVINNSSSNFFGSDKNPVDYLDGIPNFIFNFQGDIWVNLGAFLSVIPVVKNLDLGLRLHYWALPLLWVPIGFQGTTIMNADASGWGIAPMVRYNFFRLAAFRFTVGTGLHISYSTISHEYLWESFRVDNENQIDIDIQTSNHLLTTMPELNLSMEINLKPIPFRFFIGGAILRPFYKAYDNEDTSVSIGHVPIENDLEDNSSASSYTVALPPRLDSIDKVLRAENFVFKGMVGVNFFGMEVQYERDLEDRWGLGLYYVLRL